MPLSTHRSASVLLLLASAASVGCTGSLDGKNGSSETSTEDALLCGGDQVNATHVGLRRLTPQQYLRTIRDLTGDAGFDFELEVGDEVATERAVRQFRDAAESVLERSDQWTEPVFPCELDDADVSCAETFIETFGSRAFRRPVTESEHAWLMGVYQTAVDAQELSPRDALEVTLQVILQSHAFLYLYEGSSEDSAFGAVRMLTNYEVASRLSYFLWDTMPDDELLAAAGNDELSDPELLRAQAERMLRDDRAEPGLQRFMSKWLQLDGGQLHNALEDAAKDGNLYPEFDPELAVAMRKETEALIARTFFEEVRGYEALFTANYAYVNGPLADVYGVKGPSGSDSYEWVDLDADERAGILTRAAFLSVYSTATVTSPIRRGVWVIENALCNQLGDPPPNANDTKVEGGEVVNEDGELELLSVREDVNLRTMDGQCATCHQVINPIGFTFENYDAIGRWQTEEVTSGLEIDASAELKGPGLTGEMPDAVALSKALADSDQVKGCFVRNWFERALQVDPNAIDDCSFDLAKERLIETGNLREMVLAIIESNAFRYIDTAAEKSAAKGGE